MAHNNGMVPRSEARPGARVSDNAAKFQAAVEAAPSLADAAKMDPAYLAPPLAAMTGGRHLRAPPPGAAGKIRRRQEIQAGVSEYQPAGDQPTAIAELVKGVERAGTRPGAAGRHRLGQDLHHGAGDRAHPAARR